MRTGNGFSIVVLNITHPDPRYNGLRGDLIVHDDLAWYSLYDGHSWWPVPQDWAARIDADLIAAERP